MAALFYLMLWLSFGVATCFAVEKGYHRHFWLYLIVFGSLAYWVVLFVWTYVCPYFLNI